MRRFMIFYGIVGSSKMETARQMFERLGYADRYEDAVMISYKNITMGKNPQALNFLSQKE